MKTKDKKVMSVKDCCCAKEKSELSLVEALRDTICVEGFDYALSSIGEWVKINDPEFQKLLKSYSAARKALAGYLGYDKA